MYKAYLVTRHELLPAQKKALEALELEIVKKIPHIDPDSGIPKLVEEAKKDGVEVIVVGALPMPMMIPLLQLTSKEGIMVYFLKMKAVGFYESEEEAERVKNEKPDARVVVPSPRGEKQTFRVMEFDGVYLEKRIVIDEVKIYP